MSQNRAGVIGLLAAIALSFSLLCAGSSEQGNCKVTGMVFVPDENDPVTVCLVPVDFNPWRDADSLIYRVQTDSTGAYEFPAVPPGKYYVNASNQDGSLGLMKSCSILEDSVQIGTDTLLPVSSVAVTIDSTLGDSLLALYIVGSGQIDTIQADENVVYFSPVSPGPVTIMAVTSTVTTNYRVYCDEFALSAGSEVSAGYKNRPPVIITKTSDILHYYDPGTIYTDTIVAYDPEGGPVKFTFTDGSGNGFAIDSLTGIMTWPAVGGSYGFLNVSIIITDTSGAISTISWTLLRASKTETPSAPTGGASRYVLDTMYTYTTKAVACSSATTQYRFFWSKGDTSQWGASLQAQHTWMAAGTYYVRAQAKCLDYQLPSPWSDSLRVRVTAN